jgi:hypothetical protein
MSAPTTPAGRLVTAFGHPDEMATMYADDVAWSLSRALMPVTRAVWTETYRPDCEVEILDEVGDDQSSAVRIVYRAHMLAVDQPYENEYSLFVRADEDGIHEVFERLDSLAFIENLTQAPVGSTLRRMLEGA